MLAPCGAVLAGSSTGHTATICFGPRWICRAVPAATTAPCCGPRRRSRQRTAGDLTSMSGPNSRGCACDCRIGTPTCRGRAHVQRHAGRNVSRVLPAGAALACARCAKAACVATAATRVTPSRRPPTPADARRAKPVLCRGPPGPHARPGGRRCLRSVARRAAGPDALSLPHDRARRAAATG